MVDEYGHCHGECPEAKGAMDRAEAAEAERDEWKQACDACLSNGLRIAAERDAYKKASETLGREVARLLDRFNVELDAAALGVSEASVVAADLEASDD